MNPLWLMITPMIVVVAILLTITSIIALICAAIIGGLIYGLLYAIGAASVLVVSVYMWWYSLLLKVIYLDHD